MRSPVEKPEKRLLLEFSDLPHLYGALFRALKRRKPGGE
jgi:hypothetical protein